MKLAKTIQFDISDTQIFERAAAVQEWAISGTFSFVDSDPDAWPRKQRLAFRTSWLGIGSFGNSTFVQVADISASEYEQAIEVLAKYLVQKFNAPNPEAAAEAARQEIDDMATLCNHPPGTLLAIEREITGQNITDRTRVLKPADKSPHSRIWTIVEDD